MGSSESTCCNWTKSAAESVAVPSYERIEKVVNHSRHKQSCTNDANNSKTNSELEIFGDTDNPSERLLSQDNNYCAQNTITVEPQPNKLESDQNKRRLTSPLFVVDFEIFKFDTNKCEQNGNSNIIIEECDALTRFMSALQYYLSFNISDNALSHTVLTSFCNNIYKNILNDYIHIVSNHSNQFKLKSKMVGKCALSNCDYSNYTVQKSEQNGLFLFYRDLFDCVHNALFHDDDVRHFGECKRFIHPNDIMESYGQLQEIKDCQNGQCIDKIFGDSLKEIVDVYVNLNCVASNDNDFTNDIYKKHYSDCILVIGYIRSVSNFHAMIGAVNILILNYFTKERSYSATKHK